MSGLDLRRYRVSAGEMACADEGDGPPVLLLHGFPTSSHLWRDLVPMLSVRFRAIAPDLIGYGASDKPGEASLRIPALAGHVRELLDGLGVERFAVVGHDVGGGIAQILALEGGVEALVVLDGVTVDARRSKPLLKLQSAPEERADADFAEGVIRATFDLGMRRRERLPEEDLEAFGAPWRADPGALLRAARALDVTGLEGSEDRLAALEVPAFVLWGEDDAFLPSPAAERLWETLPDASIALLPGCGHYVTEDAAETVLPLIAQFLRRRYLGEEGHDHAPSGAIPVDLGVSFERPPHPADELVDE